MKRRLSLALSILLAISVLFGNAALALNYSGSQGNTATFELLEETRVSSPIAVANLETNVGRTFKSHPVLDSYPQGTTYVYRSANMYGGRAAARLNTNILVFAEQSFADKDAAFAYLKGLGLIDIIDEAIGSVILVTPSNPDAGFAAADQKNYYALQTAMLAQKAVERNADDTVYYSDAEYFGGYGFLYAIGIDGGATFLNTFVASEMDYASRIAGMLLINGSMEPIRQVASLLPVYLVNAREDVVEKYRKANDVDAYAREGAIEMFYNQARPVQQVIVREESTVDVAGLIKDAYYGMFVKVMRLPIVKQGLFSAGTPYQGYGFDEAPYSLNPRNAVFNGKTEQGINIFRFQEERFADIKTEDGEYLQTWFEYIPDEVLNGTAPDGTVPLILANHGSGDDPHLFIDENGWLELAGKERFIMVAAEHQYIETIRPEVMPQLVNYMVEKYPAIDTSRIYMTGYSMGGRTTVAVGTAAPSLFAAVACMSGPTEFAEENRAQFASIDLPFMYTTSGYDSPSRAVDAEGNLMPPAQAVINEFLGFNEIGAVVYDFGEYPLSGFAGDKYVRKTLNNEHVNHTWYFNNAEGVPMVALNYTEDLIHGLYPPYAQIGWDFMKCYSRNQETLEIVYNPYAK